MHFSNRQQNKYNKPKYYQEIIHYLFILSLKFVNFKFNLNKINLSNK